MSDETPPHRDLAREFALRDETDPVHFITLDANVMKQTRFISSPWARRAEEMVRREVPGFLGAGGGEE